MAGHERLAELAFINLIGDQATAMGNRELDRGPAALARLATLAAFPLLAANLNVSDEPRLASPLCP